MQRLQAYRWPGNIRELENVIERAIILADGQLLEVDPEQLSLVAETPVKTEVRKDVSLDTVTAEHIQSVLKQTQWIVEGPKGAAQILNMQPSTLRYRMKKLGIAKVNAD